MSLTLAEWIASQNQLSRFLPIDLRIGQWPKRTTEVERSTAKDGIRWSAYRQG